MPVLKIPFLSVGLVTSSRSTVMHLTEGTTPLYAVAPININLPAVCSREPICLCPKSWTSNCESSYCEELVLSARKAHAV